MGPIVRLEKSVRNYHYWLCSNPEEHVSHHASQWKTEMSEVSYIEVLGEKSTIHIRVTLC